MTKTRRGYLETQGDRKRLRFVKEGYDADDPNTPANAVIFDSDDQAVLSVLETGQWSTTANRSAGWIATWDYPFVPLCVFQFQNTSTGSGMWGTTYRCSDFRVTADRFPTLQVTKTGIFFRSTWFGALSVRWTAFRIPAT